MSACATPVIAPPNTVMRRNWSVFFGVLAFAQATGASEYLHPGLTAKTVSLRRLALMPARVQIAKSGVKRTETMAKESEAVADTINQVVKKVLALRGFAVLADPGLHVASLQGRFDTLAPQLLSNARDVSKGRYSMGDEAAAMAAETADAVVFIRGAGMVTTTPRALLTAKGLPLSELYCDVAVMNARTGDILFVAKVDRTPLSHDITVAAAAIEKPLTKAFEELPVGQ